MPKYSIIVPVYNAEKYIKQCVDSILSQKINDFELILSDDRSTDNSLEICRAYAEKHPNVKVISATRNGGVSRARNAGIDISEGKYLLFVDSDDFVSEDYLEVIDKNESDDIGLVAFGNYEYVIPDISYDSVAKTVESSMNTDLSRISPSEEDWLRFIIDSFFASPCNKLFKADIVKDNHIRFDEGSVCYEDLMFNLAYCEKIESFRCISIPLYYYRVIGNVKHISKRQWGELFAISRKLAIAVDSFVSEKNGGKVLGDIRRYTFSAYITELKAANLRGDLSALNILTKEKAFRESIASIYKKGKYLTLLSFLLSARADIITRYLIKRKYLN